MTIHIKNTAKLFLGQFSGVLLLTAEGLIILVTIGAFWYHAGGASGIREHWYWLLWLALPCFFLRWQVFGRIWTKMPLILLFLIFILLSAYNYALAPLHRESYLATMARPLLGMWTVIYMAELGHSKRGLFALIIATIGMGTVLGFVALTTTGWLPDKSGDMQFIINLLPHFETRNSDFPIIANLMWSFNPNEIAGALAWLTPLLAALSIGLSKSQTHSIGNDLLQAFAGVAFVFCFLALFLGQSRFAIAGVLGTLIILAILLLRGKWRILGLGFVLSIALLQVALLFNVFTPSNSDTIETTEIGISSRDESSLTNRLDIWNRAWRMAWDYPTTGVGMAMFRTAVSREPYLIPYLDERNANPPHAHNEWLQIGADMGIFGLLLFLTLQGTVLYMLWQGYQSGDSLIQVLALATFSGFLAHAVFGMGDAITLWDRFQFILWWLVGLAAAQYTFLKSNAASA